jgi:hypothetical protein
MWSLLFTVITVILLFILLRRVKAFVKLKRMQRLDREIENDLLQEFPEAFDLNKEESGEFVDWLEELQSEDNTTKTKKV